jgi:hypothetical protein
MAGYAAREQPTHTPPPASAVRHTRWFLIVYYALAVMCGIRDLYHTVPSTLDVLFPIAFAVALGWWAIVDARRRGHPIPVLARSWYFFLAGLIVPGYVIWSRGWRGAGLVLLHVVLWFVVAALALHVAGVAIYGKAWLRGLGL